MTPTNGPSQHLSWRELACTDTFRSPYPLDWRASRGPIIGRIHEDIRAECSAEVEEMTKGELTDCPLDVLEGFRTEQYQEYLRSIPRYKAAKYSQHCQGYALDLACPRLLSMQQFMNCVKRATAREGSPIQYIEYRPSMNYIHVDGGGRKNTKVIEEVVT